MKEKFERQINNGLLIPNYNNHKRNLSTINKRSKDTSVSYLQELDRLLISQ